MFLDGREKGWEKRKRKRLNLKSKGRKRMKPFL
jgi:hypothetical protein